MSKYFFPCLLSGTNLLVRIKEYDEIHFKEPYISRKQYIIQEVSKYFNEYNLVFNVAGYLQSSVYEFREDRFDCLFKRVIFQQIHF